MLYGTTKNDQTNDSKFQVQTETYNSDTMSGSIVKTDRKSLPTSCQEQLTDAGLFSYAGLCAVSLLHLFEDEWHGEFKKQTLSKVLNHLHQPQQVCDAISAMMSGHGMDDCEPYIEVLLMEPVLVESRIPLVTDLITLAISEGSYDSRMRVLIKHIAWRLRVKWDDLEDLESMLAEFLTASQYERTEEELKEQKKKAAKTKIKRFALIGLATVGGGALIGLTGGLAAPLVAAGAGVLIGGAGAAALGSTAGVAIIGSLFGVAGAGLTGYKMKRRMGSIEEFEFESLNPEVDQQSTSPSNLHSTDSHSTLPSCSSTESVASKTSTSSASSGLVTVISSPSSTKHLHITMAFTGWLTNNMTDFRTPWCYLAESREQYCLRWESKYLLQMGTAMDYIFSCAMTMATQEALKYTFLSGLIAAVAWPATLLGAAGIIDNPWSVCCERAVSAGKILAEVLLAREQGKRPVTLIGYSLGARVIFSCLEELARRKGSEGIVEDVIMLGAPTSGSAQKWKKFGRVVGGKIVNGYCRGDWLLKFLYRTASVQFSIAGLAPIKWDNRRMHNIDLSDVVNGHKDYLDQLDVVMKVVGIRTRNQIHAVSLSTGNKSSHLSLDQTGHPFASSVVEGQVDSSDELHQEEIESHSNPGVLEHTNSHSSSMFKEQTDTYSSSVVVEQTDSHLSPVVEEQTSSNPVVVEQFDSHLSPVVEEQTSSNPVVVEQFDSHLSPVVEEQTSSNPVVVEQFDSHLSAVVEEQTNFNPGFVEQSNSSLSPIVEEWSDSLSDKGNITEKSKANLGQNSEEEDFVILPDPSSYPLD